MCLWCRFVVCAVCVLCTLIWLAFLVLSTGECCGCDILGGLRAVVVALVVVW